MASKNFIKFRFSAVWSVLLALTFLSCSLIIYYSLLYSGQICSLSTGCSMPSVKQAAKLSSEECKSVCTTADCTEVANNVISSMNMTADPCEDFYEFACGNFLETHAGEDSYSHMSILTDTLHRILRGIIETSEETQIANSAAQKLKTVYDSCMDTRSDAQTDIGSLQSFLNEIGIRNWPFLESNFTFSNPTLEEVLGKLVTFEEYIFVVLFTAAGYYKTADRFLTMSVEIPSRTNFEFEEEGLNTIVTNILRLAGMDDKDVSNTWESFIEIENILAELKKNNSEEKATCYNEDRIANYVANLDCNKENSQNKNTLCKILDSVASQEGLSTRFSTERLFVQCNIAYYVEGVTNLLESHNHRALAHFIALKVFLNNQRYMNFSIRKKFLRLLKQPVAEKVRYAAEKDRRKFCVSWIGIQMKLPLGLMYADKMWLQETTDELNDIFYKYRNMIVEFIRAQDSFSEQAKMFLVEATEDLKNDIIGFIEMFKNRTFVNRVYEEFHPVKNNFLHNVMYHKKMYFILKNTGDMAELKLRYVNLFSVSASGGSGFNLMFGILLPPFFKHSYPKLFNIAQMGEIIGHEIGHTVFEVLRRYLRHDNKTNLYFKENNKCRSDQYSKFEVKKIGKNVKGNKTMNENFSDSMAIQVSETIVKNVLLNMTEMMFALPGLDFSPEELFYIYYAQAWCEVRSAERELMHYEEDIHSPPEFRVKGVFQTSQRFSEVFNCPTTSFMNLQDKCPVFY